MAKLYRQIGMALLAFGLLIRLALPLVLNNDYYKGDGYDYYRYADNLKRHGVYSGDLVYSQVAKPEPSYRRMPGVPLLIYTGLHLFDEDSYFMLLPNILMGWGIAVLLFFLFRDMQLHKTRALIMLGIYCTLPILDYYSSQFYPEVPAAFLVVLAFFWLHRFWRWQRWYHLAAAGAAVGMGVLFRPEMVLVLPVFGLALLLMHRRKHERAAGSPGKKLFLRSAIFAGAFAVVLAPWTIRNFSLDGKFSPLGTNAIIEDNSNLPETSTECIKGLYQWMRTWHFNERQAKSVGWDFLNVDLEALPESAFRSEAEKNEILAIQQGLPYTCASDRRMGEIAAERRSDEWFRNWVWLPVKRCFFLLVRIDRFDTYDPITIEKFMVAAAFILFAFISSLVNVLGLGGAVVFRQKLPKFIRFLLLAILLRLVFLAWFVHVEYRYMLIYFPLFYICLTWYVHAWFKRKKSLQPS